MNVMKLWLKYRDGEPMEPDIALAKVGNRYPEQYHKAILDLKEGASTVEEYYFKMIKMIHEYQKYISEKNSIALDSISD